MHTRVYMYIYICIYIYVCIYIYGIPQILTLVAFWLALRVIEMMSICIYLSLCVYFKKAVWNGGLSFNNGNLSLKTRDSRRNSCHSKCNLINLAIGNRILCKYF